MFRQARTTLHGQTKGLVDDKHVIIFIKRDLLEEIADFLIGFRRARTFCRRLDFQRRNTNGLPGFKTILGLDAFAIDAQFTFADDTLNMAE